MAPPTRVDVDKIYAETGVDLSGLPPVLTCKELAPVLKTSEASLAQDRYRGVGIPYIKWGARVRYLLTDVAHYLADNRQITAQKDYDRIIYGAGPQGATNATPPQRDSAPPTSSPSRPGKRR